MIDPLRITADPALTGHRCAECGSDRITASQAGVGGWLTAACYGCATVERSDAKDLPDVIRPRRVAVYVTCTIGAGTRLEAGQRVPIPCLLPDRHDGGHSPKFVDLAPKTRGAIRGVNKRGSEASKLPKSQAGSFTDLIPGWTKDGPAE